MLRIEQLCKTYQKENQALRDISLRVDTGEFVVVLGKSGSGKSTLLRCINRLVEPTSGRIFLNNEEISFVQQRVLHGCDTTPKSRRSENVYTYISSICRYS